MSLGLGAQAAIFMLFLQMDLTVQSPDLFD
jgi:hypothetical protein